MGTWTCHDAAMTHGTYCLTHATGNLGCIEGEIWALGANHYDIEHMRASGLRSVPASCTTLTLSRCAPVLQPHRNKVKFPFAVLHSHPLVFPLLSLFPIFTFPTPIFLVSPKPRCGAYVASTHMRLLEVFVILFHC
jgi:hypothetical protein